ncbi:SusC/RagA family TonB-linked outer membrane protein [Flavobacterium sp. KACC 22763]|uniref:SusC/RagA family TonB-linked outer membrane protein n=1 Tax=Flavobacterium sp. KACC 22763 TaxID=3025668 RepID=UPI0023654A39|nr:SusC/RagA family TonB-linked outer membrane protein [Flavobacterium sp. KACC 22763]WDF66032.1 SusC/RagA family TonB-linked outer membrane protein [Flavobacterium sp. KACC 22763]
MKFIQLKIVLCFAVLTLLPAKILAQNNQKINLTGIITGAEGKPLENATLVSSSDNVSVTTDATGSYSITVTPDADLVVQAPGYQSLSVKASTGIDDLSLNRIAADQVQIAFKKEDAQNLMGGVSYINVPQIIDKNYTTYSLDGVQALVGGYNGSIWGMGGDLVLVDGFPRPANSILTTEIDQITFLKGASAVALYGSRAAKGVIYITTKKGKIQKQQITSRLDNGVFIPKSLPKYLGSAEYMQYYNQARVNDGLDPLYSDETIYNFASGKNPYRYPNVNYYAPEYIKKFYFNYDANVEITGGNKVARYFTNVNFLSQQDPLQDFGEAAHNNMNRFNIRGNVDLSINDRISATIGANAIYSNTRGVNTDYWQNAATLRPHLFSPLLPISMIEPNDKATLALANSSNYIIDNQYLLGGTQLNPTNPFAAIYAGGYNTFTSRQFQFNTGVDVKLGDLLEGLSFHTDFAVDYATSYTQSYNNSYATYEATWNTYAGFDQITSLTKYGKDAKSGVQNISNSAFDQTVAFSGQFNYVKKIKEQHNVSAMLTASGFQQSRSEVYHKTSNANLGLNLGYNFNQKYFAEFNGVYVHSAKFAEGNRGAFSPTMSVGWKLSEEEFMKSVSAIDYLKLTASGGVLNTDLDVNSYYLYQSIYTQTDGAWFSWRDGALNRSTDSRRGENLDLTFAQRKEISFGLEGSFFEKLITLNSNFFINKFEGNVIQAASLYPIYYTTGWPNTSFIPYINYNDDKRTGFDFDLRFNKKVGTVDLALGFTGTYLNTEASKRAELYEDSYQNRQGKPLDALWGLKNDGFFRDANDIQNSPSQTFGQVKPGDIKYKDQNGDGIIDVKDEVYLGKAGWNGAPFTYGVNFTAKWNNFTFFTIVTGQTGAYGMKNNSYYWIDGEDKYSVNVRNSWTEETKDTAAFPRLTSLNSDNNYRSSDFWIYSTNRIDLSKVQITYDFPKKALSQTFFNGLSVYALGANLATIAKEREYMELNIGSAPQTRYFNLGLKALF